MVRTIAPLLVAFPLLAGCAGSNVTTGPRCVSVPYDNGVEHRVCDEGGRLFVRTTGKGSGAQNRDLLALSIRRAVPILHPSGRGFLGTERGSEMRAGSPEVIPAVPLQTRRSDRTPDLSTLRVEDGVPVRIERPIAVRVRSQNRPNKLRRLRPVILPAPATDALSGSGLSAPMTEGSYPLLAYGVGEAPSAASSRPTYLTPRQSSPSATRMPICRVGDGSSAAGGIDVRLPGGAQVHFGKGVDPALMAATLAALARVGR